MKLDAHIKIWLTGADGRTIIGSGRYRLLKAVAKEGSLSAAAEHLGISYRKAWGDLKKAERHIGRKLIVKSRGGHGGGKTVLTPIGLQLLSAYESLRDDVEAYTQTACRKVMKDL